MKTPPQKLPQGPIWVLTGPTASGKSALGMALAHATGAEIVAVDSVQAVVGFDIGSAKPSASERAQVPHHLIDVTRWDAPLDAHRFVTLAREAIAGIHSRGRPALLVGGTGLYIRALRDGLIAVPADAALRAELVALEAQTPGALWRKLRALDPKSAAQLAPTNPAHLMRAIEISVLTGEPASAVRHRHAQGMAANRLPMRLIWVTQADAALKAQIALRAQAMLEAGLIAEVQRLLGDGVLPGCQAMRAIGYREVVASLDAQGQPACDGPELAQRIAQATWRYARRQRTWLRREAVAHRCRLLDVTSMSPSQRLETAHLWLHASERERPAVDMPANPI